MRTATLAILVLVSQLGSVDRALGVEREWWICPAADQDSRRRHDGPGEPRGSIELLVSGTVAVVSGSKGRTRGESCEVQVEKILYGHVAEKTVGFYARYRPPTDKPIIVALTFQGGGSSSPYGLKYFLDADEEPSQTALAEARLDYNVLSSAAIFVGRELDARPPELPEDKEKYSNKFHHPYLVKVERSLYGTPLAKGLRVSVDAILPNLESSYK